MLRGWVIFSSLLTTMMSLIAVAIFIYLWMLLLSLHILLWMMDWINVIVRPYFLIPMFQMLLGLWMNPLWLTSWISPHHTVCPSAYVSSFYKVLRLVLHHLKLAWICYSLSYCLLLISHLEHEHQVLYNLLLVMSLLQLRWWQLGMFLSWGDTRIGRRKLLVGIVLYWLVI